MLPTRAKLTHMENAAFVVSALALAVSIYAVYFTRQSAKAATSMARNDSDRRADEVAERDRAAQAAARAVLVVEAAAPEQNSSPGLVVTNNGGGVATDVHVHVDGPGTPPGGDVQTRARLEPGGRWHLASVGTANLRGREADVQLTWMDESGGSRVETQIHFG